MDADYARNKRADGGFFDAYEHALFVQATVMSAPVPERAVVDAGLKAFAFDSGMPLPWKLPGAVYHRPSDEHGMLDLTAMRAAARRGDKVLLVPGHCDPTVNLHDWYVGVRGLGTRGTAHVECCGRSRHAARCSDFVPVNVARTCVPRWRPRHCARGRPAPDIHRALSVTHHRRDAHDTGGTPARHRPVRPHAQLRRAREGPGGGGH